VRRPVSVVKFELVEQCGRVRFADLLKNLPHPLLDWAGHAQMLLKNVSDRR